MVQRWEVVLGLKNLGRLGMVSLEQVPKEVGCLFNNSL